MEVLSVDFEGNYLKQGEVIFKLFFEILATQDDNLTKNENLVLRKKIISCLMKLYSNSKFKNLVDPLHLTYIILVCLDPEEELRNHILIKIVQGLFGLKKTSNGLPAVLTPLWCITLSYFANETNKEIKNTALSALNKYIMGVKRKLSKQPYVMESFTPHLI